MPKQDLTPIIVEVKDGRWDAYSINPEPTERDQMLLALINESGGINESVTPGLWSFNATPIGDTGLFQLHLLPFDR